MTDASSVVLEGWLTKSSTKQQPWKSGWKKLWFVLRSTGHIPGQFLLQYYTNDECRKLKGSIDLDELEQVDAGLSLRFGSGNKSYKHIFDIRTKTKEYYFATPSEEEMNKWVKSICSVCHLKLASSPDDEPTSGPVDYRYPPQATPPRSSITVPVVSSSSNSAENNNSPHFEERSRSDRPSKVPSSATVVVHHQKEASISSCESSGPYIPISECHSGNPNETRANESTESKSAPVAIGNASVNKNVILADELYDFPKSSSSSSPPSAVTTGHDSQVKNIHLTRDESGNNNWPNFSPCKDDIIRASVRSCSALDSSKSNSTLTRDSRNSQSFHSASRLRGASNGPTKDTNLYINGNNNCSNITNECNAVLPGREPPPRPPKPATLRRSKSKSHSSSSLGVNNESLDDQQQLQSVPQAPIVTVSPVDESYDLPKSCTGGNKDTCFINLDQIVPPSLPTVYIRGKLESFNNTSPRSKGIKLPDVTAAEMYDFPRSVESNTSPVAAAVAVSKNDTVIDLNATVPMPSLSKKDIGGKHSYTNAASGFISTKESVFNYDYKPSLPVTSDDTSNCTLSPHSEASHSSSVPERSPRTPNSAFSPSNDLTPPAVDRKFKPRKHRDSNSTASPTTPHPFPLSPAPATARKSNFCTSTLPSSKSFKNKNGQHSYDSVARSCNTLGHRGSSAIAAGSHLRAHSISEDEPTAPGRNDDHKAHSPRKQKQIIEKPELQYLDLDLNDSDNSSPRTPNLIVMEGNYHVPSMPHHKHAITPPIKERNATGPASVASTVAPPTTPKSTVYKTVDFVKTDALNKLRHTLDQTGKI